MTPRDPFWMVVKPPVVMLLCLALGWLGHRLLPGDTLLAGPLRWLGLLPVLAGIALFRASAAAFDRAGTTIYPHGKPSALVVRGPFRWTRNPIYIGMVLIQIGAAIGLSSAVALAAPVLYVVIVQSVFIRFEETVLEKTFGKSYRDYCKRVPRWGF